MFSFQEIQRLTEKTSLVAVRSLDSVESTNDVAKSICAERQLDLPCLVIARLQTRGRGRGTHSWIAGEGALTFSLVHDAATLEHQLALDQRDRSVLGLWTALGVRAGLCDVSPRSTSRRIRVKWPNDIYADDGKIAGILIETISRPLSRLVIGIGINVNCAPELVAAHVPAISLQQTIGTEIELFDVLLAVLERLDQVLATARPLRDAWAPYCFLRGRRVCTPQATGLCEGVSDGGALLVRTDDGVVQVRSGEVTWHTA